MYREIIDLLEPEKRTLIVDGTLGMGGHAELLLGRMPANGRLIGLDRDSESMAKARERLRTFGERFKAVHSDHGDLGKALESVEAKDPDAFVFDLGLSMYQLDASERGFSFLKEGPLDMRMDRTEETSAYEIVNKSPRQEIERILREYGDEPCAGKIANAIDIARRKKTIATTMELAAIVERVVFAKDNRHPATKTFQALRIAVNREYDSFTRGIEEAMKRVKVGGRIAVITFHSGEDRMIKQMFKAACQGGGFRAVNKKAIEPEFSETRENPRSRSAKLRVIEKEEAA
jgi:16S rRNA (cytosine1402-N4)-methyltransferase